MGINRNIVECKDKLCWKSAEYKERINRNIVECKGLRQLGMYRCKRVLIETLWNVKTWTQRH